MRLLTANRLAQNIPGKIGRKFFTRKTTAGRTLDDRSPDERHRPAAMHHVPNESRCARKYFCHLSLAAEVIADGKKGKVFHC